MVSVSALAVTLAPTKSRQCKQEKMVIAANVREVYIKSGISGEFDANE